MSWAEEKYVVDKLTDYFKEKVSNLIISGCHLITPQKTIIQSDYNNGKYPTESISYVGALGDNVTDVLSFVKPIHEINGIIVSNGGRNPITTILIPRAGYITSYINNGDYDGRNYGDGIYDDVQPYVPRNDFWYNGSKFCLSCEYQIDSSRTLNSPLYLTIQGIKSDTDNELDVKYSGEFWSGGHSAAHNLSYTVDYF